MRTAEIREKFLRFFQGKDHLRLPSFSVIPQDDPTLLFINAGMTPLKAYFTGKKPVFAGHPGEWYRVTTCQKSVRTGDIENVGRTNRHQTVFEMLGNFSFGDYFKREAIGWAWEFLTSPEWLGLEGDRLYVTIYKDDDEAFDYWTRQVGLAPERLHRFDADENFWPQNAPSKGPNGPCGPCSEIYYDRGPQFGSDTWADYYQTRESNRFVEIWNLVFPQYDRKDGGVLDPLPKPNIDTGMGLARVAMVLQGVRDFYDTDEFTPLIQQVVERSGVSYEGPSSVSHRVVTEHARAVSFLLADGATFSNTGRGYVVRRLLRRAVRHAFLLGIREPFVHQLAAAVAQVMGPVYPELVENLPGVQKQIRLEEEQFLRTLESGIRRLDSLLAGLRAGDTLPGEEAFRLYDTYGFPLDLTLEIASERSIEVDTAGYERALEEAQELARQNMAFERDLFKKPIEALIDLAREQGPTVFVGYETLEATGRVQLLLAGEQPLDRAPVGAQVQAVLEHTPFYAEGGGQVGDTGVLEWNGGWARVLGTQKNPEGVFLHLVRVEEGHLEAGAEVRGLVDTHRRDTERNHTATHLLHAALRAVLGSHVRQAGSYVGPDRLRFDFAQPEAIAGRDLAQVEHLVNRWIQANFPVHWEEKPLEQARREGATALFGEKYGDVVRVVSVEGQIDQSTSRELCGGCHVRRTGDIGYFWIRSDESVSAGVRRIEAFTGMGAVQQVREQLGRVAQLARELGVSSEGLPERVEKLQAELKAREKEMEKLRRELARAQMGGGGGGGPQIQEAAGYRYLAVTLEGIEPADLRTAADELLDRHQTDLVWVGSGQNLVIKVSAAAQARGLDAGAVLRKLVQSAGGRGGGKGALAQGGGFNLVAALEALPQALV